MSGSSSEAAPKEACMPPSIQYHDPKLWMEACDASIKKLSSSSSASSSTSSSSEPVAALSRSIAASFPSEWHAPNVFSPAKSDLLKALYGDRWFENIWSIPGALWLAPADFRQWTKSVECRTKVQTNALWWSSSPCSSSLSALDWHRILQACLDFDLPRTWAAVYRRALSVPRTWTPNELALFLFTY